MNEPILTEPQTEQDDWAAAMAEQQAAETHSVTDETSESSASTSAHTPGEDLTRPSPVFEQFSRNDVLNDTRNDIDMILDIPVQLTVELGRTRIAIKNLLQLAQGSVIELDGMAGEPMDVLVNGCLIAQGEVVVVNEKFGIRLTDIITPSERIRKLNR
ncbi:flagellar motor switch protein FliN/FliY [Nitrosomonas eutropha]|uniref:Flagellar motor switch protein FliN n=1 Tax=Nitrosomonas eutropha TaxID=916 RepID=A0A1I7IEQ1_9PROT|nr:flagellar motor switch protein FliN [Nitrosomonas eutropha]SFU71401.1 flagellar motor switch protein FliN/FliY [Nitrosomonas eutropha]